MVEGESSGSTSVDIDEVAGLITEKIHYYLSLPDIPKSRMRSCFIPKIERQVRLLDRAAYEPSIIPIGPYHHRNPCLQTFQRKKWSCLRYILSLNYNVQLQDYINKIAELETDARSCYLDEIQMDTAEFLQMLLIDGCFILVHLRGVDGTEISHHQIHAVDDAQQTMESNTQLDTECLTKADSFDVKQASTTMGQVEDIGTNSNGKARMQSLLSADSVSKLEPGKISQEGKEDKYCTDNQDAKWYLNYAYHDILLLENQIPFFVVKTIHEVLVGKKDSERLTDNIARFIESILYVYPTAVQEAERPKTFHHLLHLCHMYFSPNQQVEQHESVIRPEFFQGLLGFGRRYFKVGQPQGKNDFNNTSNIHHRRGKLNRWRRAVQYHETGIEFKRREMEEHCPHSLLDIRFRSGVLEIPFLFIDDITMSFFRNLIALEQTSMHLGNDFTTYVDFIAQLISSLKDVSFLVKRGILVHQMRTDEDVSVMFTLLLKNINFDRNGSHYLRSTCIALEEHYQNRVNRWMAWLWQNHFSNPWLSLGVLAAILVLVCTVLQLIFALLAYVDLVAGYSSPNLKNTNA